MNASLSGFEPLGCVHRDRYQDSNPTGSNPWDVYNPRQHDRVVKVLDLKSNGVSPRRFKSCCCRFLPAIEHLWPSGLRRYVQVVVIIRWRRFESCRVHINVLPLGPVGGSRALRPQAAGSIPVKYSISDGGLAQSVECVVSNDEAPGSKPGFSTLPT